MTIAQLGKQTKAIYPDYADIPDAELGRMIKAKFPGVYGHVAEDMDKGTVPETPKTLALQLGQLADGLRRVVFIARGSKVKVNPADYGARKLILPPGEFIYDPKAIKPKEIIAAVENHELADILGAADGGYGTVDKSQLDGPVQAVVARDADGETANSALTDEAHTDSAIAAAQQLTPAGGSVSVEPPQTEISHRLESVPPKKRRGDRWAKPGPITIPHHQ